MISQMALGTWVIRCPGRSSKILRELFIYKTFDKTMSSQSN